MHKKVKLKGPLVSRLSAFLSFNSHNSGNFYSIEKNMISKFKLGSCLSKPKIILEIKQKTFVLLLIKRRTFLGHLVDRNGFRVWLWVYILTSVARKILFFYGVGYVQKQLQNDASTYSVSCSASKVKMDKI